MLMQIINLLASARPNLGGQLGAGARSVPAGGGGWRGTTGSVREDNCAGRGEDGQDGRWQGERRRRSPRGRGGRRGGGGRSGGDGAPEAWEDGTEEKDGAAVAEPQRPGRPGPVREEAARIPGADDGVAGGEGVGRF
jgi:hypothetical protein